MSLLKKLHLPAIGGLLSSLVGLVGLAARPDVAPALEKVVPGVLTPEWSAALLAIGVAVQAITRAVHKGDVTEVEKPQF